MTTLDLNELPEETITVTLGDKEYKLDTILLHQIFWDALNVTRNKMGDDFDYRNSPWKEEFKKGVYNEFKLELTSMQSHVLGSEISKVFGNARKN